MPIDKKGTHDAIHALTRRFGPTSKKKQGSFASIRFGSSASLRERLATARKGNVRREYWEVKDADQFHKVLGLDSSNSESVTDEDIKTIDSVSAFVLSAPANDFTLVAIDVLWSQNVNSLTNPYRAFQGIRSCLEGILWGSESIGMPQIPGFMLLSDQHIADSSVDEIPEIVSRVDQSRRLKVDTSVPALNYIIGAIPQIQEIHQIRNYKNAALYMVPIRFAQGQGLHTWVFCKVGMPEEPSFMPLGEELQPATTAWEFASYSSWQFLCILEYWLKKSMLSVAEHREQVLDAVKNHSYQQEASEYRELLDKQSDLSQKLLILGNLEDWVPYLASRAQGFLSSSIRSSVFDGFPVLPGDSQKTRDFAMQIPLEITESLRDLSDMTRSLQAHVAEYVAVATMKQQYELMEQSRRTNKYILWLTVAVLVLAVVQVLPSVEKWWQGNISAKNVQQIQSQDVPKADSSDESIGAGTIDNLEKLSVPVETNEGESS